MKNIYNSKLEIASFGAGCFWGVEETFRKIRGVVSTTVGYMGGSIKNPKYKDVCSGKTGHVETIKIKYDEEKISYEKLLEIFWRIHNPTTLNRQGLDIGNQYRSVIFFHNEKQKEIAIKEKEKLVRSGIYKDPIVTEITKASKFYKAEEYHQKYFMKKDLKNFYLDKM
jgi:peptide-methionine (S)-S-oxide reductase